MVLFVDRGDMRLLLTDSFGEPGVSARRQIIDVLTDVDVCTLQHLYLVVDGLILLTQGVQTLRVLAGRAHFLLHLSQGQLQLTQ